MPTDSPLAPAVRSETAAPHAARAGAPAPSAETLIARIERAGPAALDDHELLGLVGILNIVQLAPRVSKVIARRIQSMLVHEAPNPNPSRRLLIECVVSGQGCA